MSALNKALVGACMEGMGTAVVESLLRRGASVESGDYVGLSPLHIACYFGRRAIALLLLERGADIHCRDDNGKTPLYDACRRGHASLALLVVRKGSEIDVKDKYGLAPLQWAEWNGFGPALAAEREKYLAWMRRKAFLAVLSDRRCLQTNGPQLPLGEDTDDTLVDKVFRATHRNIALCL